MRALVIGAREKAAIATLIAKAADHVTPLDAGKHAAEFRSQTGVGENAMNEALTIDIPNGYSVTYTHEEQPGGVCRHMSVSVADAPGRGPNPHAVAMLMQEFGFKNAFGGAHMWLDEGELRAVIVNVLEPLDGNMQALRRRTRSARRRGWHV
jgi:hypothetical protein